MSRNRKTIVDYLTLNLKSGNYKKANGVIGAPGSPIDFSAKIAVLNAQEKTPEVVKSYNVLLNRFLKEGFTHLTKNEWRDWTVGLIELSNFLWKNRQVIEPSLWFKTNRKIYDVSFKNFKQYDASKRVICECKDCSRLLSAIIYNFAINAKEGDCPDNFCIPGIDTMKEISNKHIGVTWYYLTYSALIENKLNK